MKLKLGMRHTIQAFAAALITVTLMACERNETNNNLPPIPEGMARILTEQVYLLFPQQYVLPGYPTSIVPQTGMDKDQGLTMEMLYDDLGFLPEGGYNENAMGAFEKGILLHVSLLSPWRKRNKVMGGTIEAWEGEGIWGEGDRVFDEKAGLFRVYRRVGLYSYKYFRIRPEDSDFNPDYWVADCSISGREVPLQANPDLTNVTCKTLIFYGDIEAAVVFSGAYIRSVDALKKRVVDQFAEWDLKAS